MTFDGQPPVLSVCETDFDVCPCRKFRWKILNSDILREKLSSGMRNRLLDLLPAGRTASEFHRSTPERWSQKLDQIDRRFGKTICLSSQILRKDKITKSSATHTLMCRKE